MLRLSLKAKLLAASTVIALGAVGVGIAAWSTSGSGTAYAGAATASPLTLGDASGATTGDLYPGATGALRLEVTNPNAFPVLITAVSGNGAITSDAGAACNAGHGVTLVSQSGLSLPLAAGATTTFTLAGAVSMSTSSVTSCQGAVFSIPVTVTAASA
jgi:hypothetical protein